MSDWDMNKLFKITRMIHNDENVARILAELFVEPASAQELCMRCDISPVKCLHTLRKLKKNGLIAIVRNITPGSDDDGTSFKYKSILDPRFVKFEDGRIKVKLPGAMRESLGKDSDIARILDSYSD
jgi:hypothetical protein